jgi:hypothetical protein
MDYVKYNTVPLIQEYLSTCPLSLKKILNVPWKGGQRTLELDVPAVEALLESETTTTPTDNNTSIRVARVTRTARTTSTTTCNDTTSTTTTTIDDDGGHILIPYSQMVDWISSSMNCRHCRATIKPSSIGRTTAGIATELHFSCDSAVCSSREPTTMEADTVVRSGDHWHSKIPKYAVNWRLLAATQLFGESQKAGEIISGFLDLSHSAFRSNWCRMEEELSVAHEEVADETINKNIENCVKLKTPDAVTGKVPITVSFDMGWQKRGRSYNSLSGHAFLIDVETGKVVAKQVYCKNCRKCLSYSKQGLTSDNYPEHNCSRNYGGSSKGMEPKSALGMMLGLYYHPRYKLAVDQMVIDDDASTRALVSHCLAELAKNNPAFEWPVDDKGKKIPKSKDVGQLPLDHPVVRFLADLMHRIRCFGKYVFALALAPQSTSTCTMVDAYRLKRNFGYWILSYHKYDFDIFQAKSKAVVEHHFNNHVHCDAWCAMKKADITQAATGNLKYRCKKENPKMYQDLSLILERFTETEKLKECHHGYSSQKNEAMNKSITRYVPKDSTFSESKSLASRIDLAIGVDSVGHPEYYQRLFDKMTIKLPGITKRVLEKMNNKRKYDQIYQALPKRKRIRSNNKFAKMKDGLKKQMADKAIGLSYETGMNLAENTDEVGEEKSKKKKDFCKYCGATTHKTRRSKSCKYNGWTDLAVNAEMVRINLSKATEQAVEVATVGATSEVQSEGK